MGYFSKPVLVILLRSLQGFSIINGQNAWEKVPYIAFLPSAMVVFSSFQELTIESLHFNPMALRKGVYYKIAVHKKSILIA